MTFYIYSILYYFGLLTNYTVDSYDYVIAVLGTCDAVSPESLTANMKIRAYCDWVDKIRVVAIMAGRTSSV